MNRIQNAFDNKKAFIGFITAGDPSLDKTEEFILEMEKAGAALVEIGIPFSDPIAEGPVIQEANLRALSAGCTTDKIFDMVDAISGHKQNVALDLYYDLLTLKEAPMRILFLITRQFRILSEVKELTQKGYSSFDIAKKVGIPEFAVRKYQYQAKNFKREQIFAALEDAAQTDEAVYT